MSIAAYPRIVELLAASKMTGTELERQISDRFGLVVDAEALYRLTQTGPIQRADLEIAVAVAAVLGVDVDDLFLVEVVPIDEDREAELRVLNPTDSQRMAALVEQQGQRLLSDAEWAELEELVSSYGQHLHEHRVRARAQRRGSTPEQEQRASVAQLARAVAEWHASEAAVRQQRLAAQLAERPAQ